MSTAECQKREGVSLLFSPPPMAPIIQGIAKKNRWDQKTLADNLGVTRGVITIWMKGEYPNNELMKRLREFAEFDEEKMIVAREYANMLRRLRRQGIDAKRHIR